MCRGCFARRWPPEGRRFPRAAAGFYEVLLILLSISGCEQDTIVRSAGERSETEATVRSIRNRQDHKHLGAVLLVVLP